MSRGKRRLSIFDIGGLPISSVEVEQPRQAIDPAAVRTQSLKDNFARIAQENTAKREKAEQEEEAGRQRIAAVRERCTETQWRAIEALIAKNSQPRWASGWTTTDIASGLAYERTYEGLTGR